MTAKIIAVANNKGGVGKTTTVLNIGRCLSADSRVLLVDLDSQANMTKMMIGDCDDKKTVAESIRNQSELPIVDMTTNISVVPSARKLSKAEKDVSSEMDCEFILQDLLKPHLSEFDYILIDCPPAFSTITVMAFVAAEYLLIPTTMDKDSINGVEMISETLGKIKKRKNPNLKVLGLLATMCDKVNLTRELEEYVRNMYGDVVFETTVRRATAQREASTLRQSIFDYKPKSNPAVDYFEVTKELKERLSNEQA